MTEQTGPSTIDEYIASYPPEVQEILRKIRQTIRETAPDAGERISYGMPTFTLDGHLVYVGAWKHHIGFYPATGLDAFGDLLAPYEVEKGTVRFPLDKPIPYDVIRTIVAYRVKENRQKAAAKRGKQQEASHDERR